MLAVVLLSLGIAVPGANAAGTVTVSVIGKGDVTGDGINCSETGGPDCSQAYADAQECDPELQPPCRSFPPEVFFTAGPDRSGYTFQGWTGCAESAPRECSTTVSASKSVTASFADTQAPSTTLTQPGTGVKNGVITLAATASDNNAVSRVEFRVGSTLVRSDTTAPYDVSLDTTAFPDGSVTISATAVDFAGNSDPSPATRDITVDNTAPSLAVDGPDGDTFGPASTQSWTFTATDQTSGVASVTCSVVPEGSPDVFGPCSGGSAGHSVANLPEGSWTSRVRATDGGGLVTTSAARSFTIDATAPKSSIDRGPKHVVRTKQKRVRAIFRLSADDDPVRFECKLDRKAFESCGRRFSVRVGRGRHKLHVRAIDPVDNVEQSPAVYRWRVKRER